jgi:hypothetical protein
MCWLVVICIIDLWGAVSGCSPTCLCAQLMDVPSRELSNLCVCTPDPRAHAGGPAVRLVSSQSRVQYTSAMRKREMARYELDVGCSASRVEGCSDVAVGLARVDHEHEVMLLLAVHAQFIGRHVKQTCSNGSNPRLKNALCLRPFAFFTPPPATYMLRAYTSTASSPPFFL